MKSLLLSRLRMARLEVGLSQGEVEMATRIWQPTLSLYERNLRPVPKDQRKKLAALYQKDEALLFPEQEV